MNINYVLKMSIKAGTGGWDSDTSIPDSVDCLCQCFLFAYVGEFPLHMG